MAAAALEPQQHRFLGDCPIDDSANEVQRRWRAFERCPAFERCRASAADKGICMVGQVNLRRRQLLMGSGAAGIAGATAGAGPGGGPRAPPRTIPGSLPW